MSHRLVLSSLALVGLGCAAAGCNLVNSSGLQTDYSFDALEYASPMYGDAKGAVVPDVACTAQDVCTMAAMGL